jgi:hypothetical protein
MDGSHNLLAAYYKCTKYALVAFSAYTHFHGSKDVLAENVWIQHSIIALRELQKEIDNFGPHNADAIVTASVALAGTAQNW